MRPLPRQIALAAVVVTAALLTACGEDAKPDTSSAQRLAKEVSVEIEIMAGLLDETIACSNDDGTFETCPGWDKVEGRSLRQYERLRNAVSGNDGTGTERCDRATQASAMQFAGWHDRVVVVRNAGGTGPYPGPESLEELTTGIEMMKTECAAG